MITILTGFALMALAGLLSLTERQDSVNMVLSMIVLLGLALVVIGDEINTTKKEILDALAKGQASQGARQQGRDATQAKGIHDKEEFGHWHRTGLSESPYPVPDCVVYREGRNCLLDSRRYE